jgi:cell division protein FtsB
MDFRIERGARARKLPTAEEGLRAIAQRLPEAEALAASKIEPIRPLLSQIYAQRRRIATVSVIVLTISLFVHVMFGANGMVVYKQKRAEFQGLQKRIVEEQRENETYTHKIQDLKTDEKAIEKEAREQLRYVRPGEYIYVPPPAENPPPAKHTAKN